ncbi:hypothetical protein acdb102_26450 [Acidothermaceae bacterium B102]|nr:hypothetical protein acdb102_26450 [Acidothermaceae bacterium B102]
MDGRDRPRERGQDADAVTAAGVRDELADVARTGLDQLSDHAGQVVVSDADQQGARRKDARVIHRDSSDHRDGGSDPLARSG